MKLVIFEDSKYRHFFPASRLRTVCEIQTGKYTQKGRAESEFECEALIHSPREGFGEDIKQGEDMLFINGRLKNFSGVMNLKTGSCLLNNDGEILAYRFDRILKPDEIESLDVEKRDIPLYNYIWDIIGGIENQLETDLKREFNLSQILSLPDESVNMENPDNIFIDRDVKIGTGVSIIADDGPVYIEKGCFIGAGTVIEGPVYLGKNCVIKPGSIINTVAAGDVTKMSGEIEESIFQGYSNKQHFGFLGHAYVGEWVNLGAGTTNSDLKNNYSEIRVSIEDAEINTGMQFLGLMIGDHSKTAINTSFNTGTIIEPFCNIFGRDFPPKYLPPFTWWSGECVEYKLDKAIDTARIVMGRRNIVMDVEYESKIKELFRMSGRLRENW